MNKIKHVVSKFETKIPANDDIVEIELRKLTKQAEKMKWFDRFRQSYKGELLPTSLTFFGPDTTYLVASVGKIDLGYIRIIKRFDFEYTDEVYFSISEMYVKPAYRHQRIAEKMIQLCVDNYYVQMIYIEWDRVVSNPLYFKDLGFIEFLHTDNDLGYLIHKSLINKSKIRPVRIAA